MFYFFFVFVTLMGVYFFFQNTNNIKLVILSLCVERIMKFINSMVEPSRNRTKKITKEIRDKKNFLGIS